MPRLQFATGIGYYGNFSGYFVDLRLTSKSVSRRSANENITLWTTLVFFTCFAAYAHPPYEDTIGFIDTPKGRVEIREGYVDGIVFSDPIRLAAYSGTNLVASTGYEWNTSIVSLRNNAFHAFQFRTPFSLFASQVWRFDAAGLKEIDSAFHVAVSPVVWLWTRPISHFTFGILLSLPIIFTIWSRPWQSKGIAVLVGSGAVLFLTAVALCTLLVSVAFAPCSLWITLSISLAAIAVTKTMISRSNKTHPANHESHR